MKIGFMQGRLSPLYQNKIQAFPYNHWENEFSIAKKLNIELMEWTVDSKKISNNPIYSDSGRRKIVANSKKYNITINSLTADCIMQEPFWRNDNTDDEFIELIEASKLVGIEIIVFPLVDNSSLTNLEENYLISYLLDISQLLQKSKVKIAFESDFDKNKLARFIDRLPIKNFGINYDIGNSAALGYLPKEEIAAYGSRILNVHVKDRVKGGATIKLGEGDADFEAVFQSLQEVNYQGNFIIQAARTQDNKHDLALLEYYNFTKDYINKYKPIF